jgi:hypothetical protein
MNDMVPLIEKLTGESAPLDGLQCGSFPSGGIGHGQFNELLLALGYDRVSGDFFRYIFGSDEVRTFRALRMGIDGFRKKSMLKHGNFKYSFKTYHLASMDRLREVFDEFSPADATHFAGRHDPLLKLHSITRTEAPALGYISSQELERRGIGPTVAEKSAIIDKGIHNHQVYLTYDHLDVYVATSLRKSLDYWNVHDFVSRLFCSPLLKELKLRWFDPTQAYCQNRVDKGLVEGLMLKRAKCTIYLAQESETLGKDLELATTLVQGKPVIAYVPSLQDFDQFYSSTVELRDELYRGANSSELIMELLRLYYPEGAWTDETVKNWLRRPAEIDFKQAAKLIFQKAKQMYDGKAKALKEYHPLGLQVNLETGVANGVLVVRTIAGCAKVLRAILLRTWEFDIEDIGPVTPYMSRGKGAALLRERMTGCVFRAVTDDDLLTNTFWNFYGERSLT